MPSQQSPLDALHSLTAKTSSWSFDYHGFHITTNFASLLWCIKLIRHEHINVEDVARVGWILRELLAETKARPFTVPRFLSELYKGSLAQSHLDSAANHFF